MRTDRDALARLRLRLAWAQRFVRDGFVSSLLWAALAGITGAFATIAFRGAIASLVRLETGQLVGLVEAARSLPPLARALLPAAGGLIGGLILVVRRRDGRPTGDGGDYMESVIIGDGDVPFATSFRRSLSSLFSIASGGSIGREGPMVQLAAACASTIGRISRMAPPQRRLIVACGAAAGVTSAYNAPLAGALFVAEIVLGSLAVETLTPLLVAAMVSNLTTHAVSPDAPLYPIAALPHPHETDFVTHAAIGLVAGLCAPLFMNLLNGTRRRVQSVPWPLPLKMALGGLLVGLVSIDVPEVWGNGYSTINAILAGDWVGQALLWMLVCKLAATASTVGSGAIGGVFTPTLFVGAALGSLLIQFAAPWSPIALPPAQAVTAVAMSAFLAATTQAPLTAILMVLEMTGAWTLVLPLMLACVVAYLVVRTLGVPSIYAAAEHRRRRESEIHDLSSRTMRTLMRPSPPTAGPGDALEEVARAFTAWRFQYLYVVEPDGHYVGAISLHDLRQAIEHADATAPRTAASLVTSTLQTVTEDTTLEEALERFRAHRGERLPVLDGTGHLVGAVWKSDLLLELQQRLGADR